MTSEEPRLGAALRQRCMVFIQMVGREPSRPYFLEDGPALLEPDGVQ